MKQILKITCMLVSFLPAVSTSAQQKKPPLDSLSIYREFIKCGSWYQQLPLLAELHLTHRSTPPNTGSDSIATDMTLYYGKHDFYMRAEGLEQIVNDTLMVMVNEEAKMIRIYPNSMHLQERLQKTALMFLPDSSFLTLVNTYTASMYTKGDDTRQINFQSRQKLMGTTFSKEEITIDYKAGTYQPISFKQSKFKAVPVDSTTYNRMFVDPVYSGKLFHNRSNEGEVYFLIKEEETFCRFTKVNHEMPNPPVRQQDRVVKGADDNFFPSRGFEGYLVTKEF